MGGQKQNHRALSADRTYRDCTFGQFKRMLGLVGSQGHSPGNRAFARKTGHQISAIRKMLDRLAGGPAHTGTPPSTFGTPQNFSVSDNTPTSVELIWQANNAATGFNVYRSDSSAGTYTKINSSPVSGASFVDRDSLKAPPIITRSVLLMDQITRARRRARCKRRPPLTRVRATPISATIKPLCKRDVRSRAWTKMDRW